MADVTDVAEALVAIIAAAVYPNGTSAASIAACPIMVYQGWPDAQTLDQDLSTGKVHISVWPRPGEHVTSVVQGLADWDEDDNDGTDGHSIRELRRQSRSMQITIWAPTFTARDLIAKQLDPVLAATSRFDLVDGTQAILSYEGSTQVDQHQKTLIYRRDLIYAANYATVQTEAGKVILHTITNVTGGPTEDAQGTIVHIET